MNKIMIHVPKTAGRFIKTLLKDDPSFVKIRTTDDIAHFTFQDLFDKQFIQTKTGESFVFSGETIFGVSRDPYAWAESYFQHFLQKAQFGHPLKVSFERFICDRMFAEKNKTHKLYASHNLYMPPQSHWLAECPNIFKVENLKEDLASLFNFDGDEYDRLMQENPIYRFNERLMETNKQSFFWTGEMFDIFNESFDKDFKLLGYNKA